MGTTELAVNYDKIISEKVSHLFSVVESRMTAEDMSRIRDAYNIAEEAHRPQKRKSGAPYIIHPIEVATIIGEEFGLDANMIIAAFLHDVVEDTPYTIEDIELRFGTDVAFLVGAVTKKKKEHYEMTKQLDNFKQMLDSVHYDIRAILIKLADRLHNMRTLDSMRADKQMKIAGETDYFYAPLANRLGLYVVKSELENLSMQYRCPQEYAMMVANLEQDKAENNCWIESFKDKIKSILTEHGISVRIETQWRMPYSIWRKMESTGNDYRHVEHRQFVRIVFQDSNSYTEKDMALKIYSILTDNFKEKPGSINNYIDTPKENGYQSFHVKLLTDIGQWEEIHISSERMVCNSHMGCVANQQGDNLLNWIEKFKAVLKDIAFNSRKGGFIESVVSSFYNDDIMVYTPKGESVILPKGASALDFAFEIHSQIGAHAQYARINGKLCSVKTILHRGDCVEIGTHESINPKPDWSDCVLTYKAKRYLKNYHYNRNNSRYNRCKICYPLPGDEVIGFEEKNHTITIHKRDCKEAISLVSQFGDSIVSAVLEEKESELYPVKLSVKAVDRYHLLSDLIDTITNELRLSMLSFNTYTEDEIVTCDIVLSIHSIKELQTIIAHLDEIPGVEEIRRTTLG